MKEDFKQLLCEINMDVSATLNRMSNNEELFEYVILKFIEQDKEPELSQAMQVWNVDKAEQIAHMLKGVSGNLGMTMLSDNCDAFVRSIRSGKREAAEVNYLRLNAEYKRIFHLIQSYRA